MEKRSRSIEKHNINVERHHTFSKLYATLLYQIFVHRWKRLIWKLNHLLQKQNYWDNVVPKLDEFVYQNQSYEFSVFDSFNWPGSIVEREQQRLTID